MTPKVHFSVVLFCLISAAVCELCPLKNGEYVDFVPHEYDCTKFYKCDWGELNFYNCPSGLHFNTNLNVCDWPENAGCNSGSSSTPRPTVAPTASPTAPPQTPPPTSTTTGSGNNGPQGVCPPINGEFVDFLPHESDCTKFYKCDWGVPILFDCPSGLHFNTNLNVCDWPENAGCNSGSSSTPRPTAAPTAPPQTPPPTSTTTGSGNNGPQGVCPPINGEFVDFLPHESDCTKFYKCDWGVPILFDCPSGLHFNPILNVCDWPENAGCNSGSSSTPQPTVAPTVAPTASPTAPPQTPPPTSTTTGSGNNGPQGVCPPLNGEFVDFLPHESDCTKFYKCDWGVPILFDCPSGLHFNPTLNVCDWPENAGCNSGSSSTSRPTAAPTAPPQTPPPTSTTTGSGNNGPQGVCPTINGEFVDFLPHESDCTKFYKCDWGVPILFDCPSGLHFNPTLNVCDWPENAGCNSGSSSTPQPTVAPTAAPTASPTAPPQTPPPTSTTTGSGNNGPQGVCPPINGEFVDFLPHESDCTKFYKCDWGVPILFDCPSGLHFNPTLNVCDWPENAGCNSGSSSTPRPTVVPTASPPAPPQTPPPTSTTTGSGNNGPQGVCPPINGEFVDFLPHESDCTKFYKCDWGVAILFDCPSGLHFNPTLNVCDWPENAGCNSGSSSTSRPTVAPTAAPTASPTAPPQTPPPTSTTTGSGNNGPQGVCPPINGEFVDFLPHESDCTKFYKCDWGVPILFDCPSGLHFNPTLNVCDWPENAGCNSGSSSTPRPTVAPTASPTAPPQTPPPTSTTTGSGNNGPQGVCPPINGEFVDFLPHESDCTKFYKCDWGVAILFDCPSGLHFNPTLNVCDWPENAGCNSGSSSTPRPTVAPTASPTAPPQTPPPTSTTTGSGNNGPQGVCPPINGEFVDFLPHESDCTKFYKCDWGVPILFDCPSGLHFNPTLNVCDWPENAGCNSGSPSTPRPTVAPTAAPTASPTAPPQTPPPTSTTTGSGNNGPQGVCPPINGEFVDFLPHESDCTKFYKCDWGRPILFDCPSGLHFNLALNVCDWPENAGCR